MVFPRPLWGSKANAVVVVRVFAKKTQKTPRREIELVLKRAEEVK